MGSYPNVYVCTGPLYLPEPNPDVDGRRFVRYEVIGSQVRVAPLQLEYHYV